MISEWVGYKDSERNKYVDTKLPFYLRHMTAKGHFENAQNYLFSK